MQPAADQPTLANFNPWRIMAPAGIALVVVFGVIFLLTRGTSQTPTNQPAGQAQGQTGLVADPNGQPVQATGTPTGESERGIQPIPSVSPSSRNANANASQAVVPGTASGEFGSNDNANGSAPGNKNGNKNANQRESPPPKPSPTVDKSEPPTPPRPSPSARNTPKSAVTP